MRWALPAGLSSSQASRRGTTVKTAAAGDDHQASEGAKASNDAATANASSSGLAPGMASLLGPVARMATGVSIPRASVLPHITLRDLVSRLAAHRSPVVLLGIKSITSFTMKSAVDNKGQHQLMGGSQLQGRELDEEEAEEDAVCPRLVVPLPHSTATKTPGSDRSGRGAAAYEHQHSRTGLSGAAALLLSGRAAADEVRGAGCVLASINSQKLRTRHATHEQPEVYIALWKFNHVIGLSKGDKFSAFYI